MEEKKLDLETMRSALMSASHSRNGMRAINEHVIVETAEFGSVSLLYRDDDMIALIDVSTQYCADFAATLLERYEKRMWSHVLRRGDILDRTFDEFRYADFGAGDIDIEDLRHLMWDLEDEDYEDED
jgi:hypothetical protein